MIDNVPEQQNTQPRKEIQLDQWSILCENYAEIPPGDALFSPADEKFFTNKIKFITPNVGKWALTLKFYQEDYELAFEKPDASWPEHSMVMSPNAEIIISDPGELLGLQKKMEKRLLRVGFQDDEGTKNDDEWEHQNNNLKVTLRSPSGRKLYIEFSETGDTGGLLPCWTDVDTKEIYDNVYLPDSGSLMKQMQIKIEKTGGGEN